MELTQGSYGSKHPHSFLSFIAWAAAVAVQLYHRRGEGSAMNRTNEEAHWRKTTNLMLTHLAIWFFFGYIIHMFVLPLNKIVIPIVNFPLGFYMAAQGSLIVIVVQLFLFAKQQNRIDREFGYAEED